MTEKVFDIGIGTELDLDELQKELKDGLSKAESEVIRGVQKQTEIVNEAAQKNIEIIRKEEEEKIALVKSGVQERIAAIKSMPDLSSADKQKEIKAIKEAADQEIRIIKDKAKLSEAAIKTMANNQIKTYNDLAKKQIKVIQDANKKSLQSIKEFAKGAASELVGLDQVLASLAGGPAAWGKLVVDAGRKIISTLNEWANSARESIGVQDTLKAVIKSTGAESWTTASTLNKLAKDQSEATGRSRDEITQMQSVLLGFRSVTKDVFGDATSAIMDMSKVMGGDLRGAANMLGKALDTPVQGMSALSRVGFVFTEEQKKMIKILEESGDHLGAQKIILGEVQAAFSGAATATSPAIQAQVAYNNAIEDFKKTIGTGWAEAMSPVLQQMANLINWYTKGIEGIQNIKQAQLEYKRSRDFVDAIDEEIEALKEKNLLILRSDEYLKLQEELRAILHRSAHESNQDIIAQNDIMAAQIEERMKLIEADGGAALLSLEEKKKGSKEYNAVLQNEIDLLNIIKSIDEGGEAGVDFSKREKKIAERYRKELIEARKASGEKLDIDKEYERLYGLQQEALAAQERKRLEEQKKAEQQANIQRLMSEEDYRNKNQEALEKEIAAIKEQAKLEKKSLNSAEVRTQILNARKNAYLSLVKEIGSAGAQEQRKLAEIQAESYSLAAEAANKLTEDNLKNLKKQEDAIKLKAEIEGRSTDSMETQKEIMDAQVNAYHNQLKILQDIIDGTGEEETARRKVLQAQWDQYKTELQTATAQKKRLEEAIKLQEELNNKVKQLYDDSQKELHDRLVNKELNKLSEARIEAEKKANKIITREREALNKAAIETIEAEAKYRIEELERESFNKISRLKTRLEELQQNITNETDSGKKRQLQREEAKLRHELSMIDWNEYQKIADEKLRIYSELMEAQYGVGAAKRIRDFQQKILNDYVQDIEKSKERLERIRNMSPEEWLQNTETGEEDRTRRINELATHIRRQEEGLAQFRVDVDRSANEKIKQAHLDLFNEISSEAQKFFDALSSISNSISTMWTNDIEYRLNEDLIANDKVIQSDEERAKKEKELTIKAAQEKYKADLFAWSANATMAAINASMAILKTMAEYGFTPLGIAMMAAVTAAGAMQVAAVISARPKQPRFHSGGVVEGRGEQSAILKGGEVVQTQRQFQNTMQAISNLASTKTGTGGVQMNVKVVNNASGKVEATPRITPEGLEVVIEGIVNKGFQDGTFDRSIAKQQSNRRGGVFL